MEVHHKHGPITNWREFTREIGIIVIGIAIALSGEQAIEAFQHHREIQEVRQSLKEEMAFNLATLKDLVDQTPCSTRRLDEIEEWANSLQSGRPLHLAKPAEIPLLNIFRTAAWRAAPADSLARLPLQERNSYAYWYDGVDTETKEREIVFNLWTEIRRLSRARQLSGDQQLQLSDDIDRLRRAYRLLGQAYSFYWPPLAKSLGVTPIKQRHPADYIAANASFCQPLLAS